MSQQTLNVGTNPNDGTGDPVRNAMIKVQNNFSDLYTNYVSNAQLASNLVNYQTTAGLAANVLVLTANSSNYIGNLAPSSLVTGTSLVANLANYPNTTQLSSNLANYQTTAGLAANVAPFTVNNALYLNGIPANSYVNTTGNYVIGGTLTFSSNLTIANTVAVYANGSLGMGGQVLTSNGGSVYWSTLPGPNLYVTYVWSNSHTFTNTVTINGNVTIGTSAMIVANGAGGTNSQILTSNGTTIYWSSTFAGTANNTNFVGTVSAANVVSNAQLFSNLILYQTISGMSSYQTTAGLSANIASYLPTYTGVLNASSIAVSGNATISGNTTVGGSVTTGYIQINNQTANYTLSTSDSGKVITVTNNTSSAVILTANYGLPAGFRVMVTKLGSSNVQFANGSGISLGSRSNFYVLANTYASASLLMVNTSFAVIDGAIG